MICLSNEEKPCSSSIITPYSIYFNNCYLLLLPYFYTWVWWLAYNIIRFNDKYQYWFPINQKTIIDSLLILCIPLQILTVVTASGSVTKITSFGSSWISATSSYDWRNRRENHQCIYSFNYLSQLIYNIQDL